MFVHLLEPDKGEHQPILHASQYYTLILPQLFLTRRIRKSVKVDWLKAPLKGSAVFDIRSNYDDDGKKNVTLKMTSQSFKLLCHCSGWFHLSNEAELSRSGICKDGVTVQGEKRNSTSCVHVLHKTLSLVISRCSCTQNGK